MSIEKFDPKNLISTRKSTLLERALSIFVKSKESPSHLEFYNKDKTRRYEFYEWKEGDNFRQLNVALEYKIGWSWGTIMKAMTRWENQEEQAFGIEVEGLAVQDDVCKLATYWYDHSSGGKKRFSGMEDGRLIGVPGDVSEAKRMVQKLGFPLEKDLPEYINFEGTIKQFMLKAKRLDFSNPTLITKPLIK